MNDVRKHLVWASVVLVLIGTGMVVFADAYLRQRNIPGTKPESWDAYGSVIVVVGGLVFLAIFFDEMRQAIRRWFS